MTTVTGLMHFTYDKSDQPVGMDGQAPNTRNYVDAAYLYDGNMKRVKSVVNGKTIYNVYDLSGRLVHIEDSGNETDYLHGMGQTLARIKNGTFTYLHPDHLGSPQLGTTEAGSVSFTEHYTPYGEALLSPAANDNQSGFTGHIKDKDTGLNYMQARYYDPNIGRFLSIDPVTFLDTGNPGYFNRYVYTMNDPINMIDPNGEETTCSDGNSVCVTKVDSAQAPTGRDPSVATNANDSNMRSNDATGTPALDQAASEVADILNQRRGNERAFRMDVSEGEDGEIVTTTEIETTSSSPSHAAFNPSEVSGADGFLHTEPTNANTGVPGTGDGAVPKRFGIPNYQAYGKRVNANEISGGVHQIRPVNHRRRTGLRRRANDHQNK